MRQRQNASIPLRFDGGRNRFCPTVVSGGSKNDAVLQRQKQNQGILGGHEVSPNGRSCQPVSISDVNTGTDLDDLFQFRTRCFYNSAIDSKSIKALIARGNARTRYNPCLGKKVYKTRHVTNSNLDVDPSVTSQGVVKRPGGGIIHQAQMEVKINKIPNQSQINSSANSVCMVKDDANVAGKVVKAHSHENVQNDMTHDVKSVNQVIVTDSPKEASVVNQVGNCVRIFDVNRSCTNKYLHSGLARSKVKRVLTNDQLQCQTFK